jgi:hypothetical protein
MMNLHFFNKESFYFPFYENQKVPNVYKNLIHSITQKKLFSQDENRTSKGEIQLIDFFPNYLDSNVHDGLICRNISQLSGFAINLEEYNNSKDYLNNQFSSSTKKTFRRSINRLESCFNIEYKMFYGNITKEDYDFVTESLHKMIATRFRQREGKHAALDKWEYYVNLFFILVNEKKASIFVIYNEHEPIEISLNYHFDNILFSYISSYNTDYSKFSLGNIEIYKQLEWCISNDIMIFDMGFGDYPYKRKWSNLIYEFETHIVSTPNNKLALIYSLFLKNKFKLKNYLISKNINTIYNNIKDTIKGQRKSLTVAPEYTLDLVNDNIDYKPEKLNIDNNEHVSFLKEPLHNYLYSNNEHISDISVYEIDSNQQTFLFKGKNTSAKLTFA